MATHSSVLAWRIPGTGEPGGLPSLGSQRVRHNWSDLAAAACSASQGAGEQRMSTPYIHTCSWYPWVFSHDQRLPSDSALRGQDSCSSLEASWIFLEDEPGWKGDADQRREPFPWQPRKLPGPPWFTQPPPAWSPTHHPSPSKFALLTLGCLNSSV